jgi:hypothetical protein
MTDQSGPELTRPEFPVAVEPSGPEGFPRTQRPTVRPALRVAILALAVIGACLVLAAPSAVSAALKSLSGRAAITRALEAIRAQDADRARRSLSEAERDLDSAASSLDSIWTLPARLIPPIGRQLTTARSIARAGALTARAGSGTAEAIRLQGSGWGVRSGTIDIASLEAAAVVFRDALGPADEALAEIESAHRRFLVPPLGSWRRQAEDQVASATSAIRKAEAGLGGARELLGGNGRRRYLVLNSNLSEQRGTGGFLGYFAVLDVENGKMTLAPESGRPANDLPNLEETGVQGPDWFEKAWGPYGASDIWQNVNMSTDFPTVAQLIIAAIRRSPGPIDGLLQIDPYGLSALLKIAGPVSVPGWPEPIDADNLPRISQHDAYVRYPDLTERDAFGEQLLRAVFARFVSSTVDLTSGGLEGLGAAVVDGHIKMYSSHTEGQQAVEKLEMDGGLQRHETAGDVLGVFNENGAGNKVDWFLHRDITYDLTVDPGTGNGVAELTITLRNDAPESGEPWYVIGPYLPEFLPGQNSSILALLRPPGARLTGLTVNGAQEEDVTVENERSLRLYQIPVDVDAGQTATVKATFFVPDVIERGTVDFRFIHQTVINLDRLTVRVHSPRRWHVTGAPGGPVEPHSDLKYRIEARRSFLGLLTFPIDTVGRALKNLF